MADGINFDKAALVWTLPWDADWVTAVSFLGNTRKVAAGNNLGQILLWELPEKAGGPAPKPTRRLDGHSNVVSRLVSTSDGRWLISSSYDHTIRCWDMQAEAKETGSVVLNERARYEAANRRSGPKPPEPVEVKVQTQQSARVLSGHGEWVTALALSRDEKLLLSGDDGGQVIVWDREAGKEVRRWKTPRGWVYALALSPDSKQSVVTERVPLIFDSGRHDGVKLWDATTGQVQRDLGTDFKGMHLAAAAYSLDGKLLALARGGETSGAEGKVYLVDPATGKKVRELLPGHLNGATDLAFHPDGKHLFSCGRDTLVRIWDTTSGKLVKELGKSRGGQSKDWIHALSFSADGRWLAAADMVGAVQVWSLAG
jgi:WD40 repeat protein